MEKNLHPVGMKSPCLQKNLLYRVPAIIVATLILVILFTPLMTVSAQNTNQVGEPTSTPQVTQSGRRNPSISILGIVVLVSPIVFLAWKSRKQKAPDIKAVSCLPVIDGEKHPFSKEGENDPAPK